MKKSKVVLMLSVLTLCFVMASLADSKDFKGINFPDKIKVGDVDCSLNGIGLRKKMMVDVYAGALYLKTPSSEERKIVDSEEPKALLMHVIYKAVDADKWQEGWKEGFAITSPNATEELKKKIEKFIGFFSESVLKGEQVLITYDPGKGTEVVVKGKSKGVIEGSDFMKALWGIWFGPKPVSKELKEGMMGVK